MLAKAGSTAVTQTEPFDDASQFDALVELALQTVARSSARIYRQT